MSFDDGTYGDGDALRALRESLAGRFEITEEAGRGGMAIVYQGLDIKHQRPVALKVLRPELSRAIDSERFLREIRIEAQLNHPNILTLIDSGQSGDVLYYLTPWAEGGTLRERLDREQQLSLDVALQITKEIGEALVHAHSKGVVHRDVKPQNVLFRGGHALLADFGIAQAVADADRESLTESGLAIGTPTYMSPEQATPGGSVDERSDQYALACILFEMLAGDPPFIGRSSHVILTRHLTERPPSLTVVRPDLPPHVVAAINRALEKAPAGRFASVEQFLHALTDSASAAVVVPARQKGHWRLAGVALAVIAVATTSLLLMNRNTRELSPDKVAVFPLALLGLPAADSGVGVGVAYLIEAALERADPLQLIDVSGRLTEPERRDPQTISDRSAYRIAREVGAAFVLRGVVLGHDDSTTVTLRLETAVGDSLIRPSSATGATRAVPIHHLGLDALKPLLSDLIDTDRVIDLTPWRNRRAQSIALWMQGERHYRRSQFDSASRLYERALADDSLLTLAAIKGGQAASWMHNPAKALQLVRYALTLERELPAKYALLARGIEAWFTGEPDSAVRVLRRALAIDPAWAEPSAALGEVFTHLLPNEARLDSLARQSFRQALERDSGFTPSLFHLAEDAIREERLRDADRLIARLQIARAERTVLRQLQLMRECVARPTRMIWSVSSAAEAGSVFAAAQALSAGAKHPICAEGAQRALLQSPHTSDGERWGAFLGLHGLTVARRDDTHAKSLVDSIVAAGRGPVRTAYVLDAIAGVRTMSDADSLVAFAQRRFGINYEQNQNPEALWVLMSWHRERGDADRVHRLADLLRDRAATTPSRRGLMFAHAARAQAALADHDTSAAIEALQHLPPPGTGGDLTWGFADALPVERLLLARLLLAEERYAESMAAADIFDHPEPVTFVRYVGESLGIRYRAALALAHQQRADSFRRRLELLGRVDLIDAANPTRR